MALWLFSALMGSFATVTLMAGIWLMLHLPDVARVFSANRPGTFLRGSGRRLASPGAVWLALILFNGGWIACVVLWVFLPGSDANPVS